MKKLIFLAIAVIVIAGLLLAGCAKEAAAPAPAAPAPAAPAPAAPAPAAPAKPAAPAPAAPAPAAPAPAAKMPSTTYQPGTPVYGGTLRMIAAGGPQVLSYVAAMGPGDHSGVFPAAEGLVQATDQRMSGSGVEPFLCESVDDDYKNLKITWHLRKGIMFHDGTEMTADVVMWNFQMIIDAKALPNQGFLKDMQVVDKYTLVMNLTKWSNRLMPDWGYWPVVTSKAAFDKASGGDVKKGIEWQRVNVVGTGPFILKEYKRDDHMTWVKNPNYWQPGRPYLDGIQVRYIPDAVTARAAFQAGEADMWGAPASMVADLEKMGYKRQQAWPRLPFGIWPNTVNPNSKMADKRVREAVEYAIDKAAIAKAIGFGIYEPMNSLPMSGEWGYDPNYNPRPYNPAKAKELLTAAGYPNGLKVNLMIGNDSQSQSIGVMVKGLLDAAGFQVNLDIADPGRYGQAYFFSTPGPDQDMLWAMAGGMDSSYLQTYFRWFSTAPFSDVSYLGHAPEQAQMDADAQAAVDPKDQAVWCGKLMRALTDNAKIIPVYAFPMYVMQQPYVHSTEYTQGFTRWDQYEIWMDKH
jgi:peptide/nickel transport system substrate-binding protein